MTQLDQHVPARAAYRSRTCTQLAAQQIAAIEDFHRACRAADAVVADGSLSREEQLDRGRQRDVRRREHTAIISRCDHELRLSGQPLADRAARRAVLAHRSDWFLDKIASILAEHDVHVVARLDNGADAVGTVVAEQPDVLLVEDRLAMLAGEEVIREAGRFASDTAVVAQVAYSDRVGVLMGAGAAAVFTRQTPPGEVAQGLLELLALKPG